MADEEDRWQRLIQGLRHNDGAVAREFCDQYGAALHRLAEQHLAPGVRRRVGAEDVVQSVCRTFFRRAGLGQFQLSDCDELWRLLCAITLAKVREQVRFHRRHKRGLDQEVTLGLADPGGGAGYEPAAGGPSPAEAAEFADQYRQLLASFDEEERQVLELKLQEHTHEEVAAQLGTSERTVRRIVKRLQDRLARAFEVA